MVRHRWTPYISHSPLQARTAPNVVHCRLPVSQVIKSCRAAWYQRGRKPSGRWANSAWKWASTRSRARAWSARPQPPALQGPVHGVLVRLWQPLLHDAGDQGHIREHAHVWEDAHVPQDRQQLPVPRGRRLLFSVNQAEEWRTLVGRGHAQRVISTRRREAATIFSMKGTMSWTK